MPPSCKLKTIINLRCCSKVLTTIEVHHHVFIFTVNTETGIHWLFKLALNKTQQSWKTDNENLTQWLVYFLTILKKQSEQELELINTDQVESLLSEKQTRILHWARESSKNEFSRKDVIQALELPTRTVQASIKRLVELKQFERLGMGRASRYKLIS